MRIAARIIAYRISNGGLAAAELPRRLKFLDWGNNPSAKGPVTVSAMTAAQVPVNQQKHRWDRIAIDYEHNTLKGTPEYERSQEPRAVAAYGTVVCVPGDGMFLDDIEWTPHGKQFAREYIDLSPAPLQTTDGTVIGMHSVALCRHGAVDGLQFYSVEIPDGGEKAMDWKKWLCGLIGAKEDVSDADLQQGFLGKITALCAEACAPFVATIEDLKTKVVALSAAVPEKAGETITALSADVTALKGQVASYAAETLKRDRADVLAQAAREGKIVALSADAVEKLSLADLSAHVAGLPVTVPLDQRTPERIVALSAEAVAAGSALDVVARACGLDPAKVAAANK